MELSEIGVFVGVDMAKTDHFAQTTTTDGVELFARSVLNDQTAIEKLIDDAASHGAVAVVIDITASHAQLLLAVAADREVPVAYVTGLQMRRAADLYAGSAKTDPRDAWVLADFARRNADRLTWLDVGDELLLESRVLNGRDVDLATDANRIIDCTRDALTAHNNTSSRSLQPMQVPATVSGMATRPSGSDQADIAHSEGAPWVKMVDAVAAPAFESVFVL